MVRGRRIIPRVKMLAISARIEIATPISAWSKTEMMKQLERTADKMERMTNLCCC
jgi:hypothetical protein